MSQTIVFVALLAACLFVPAGKLDWTAAWAFLLVCTAFIALAFFVLDPELIAERSRFGAGVKRWDLVLATAGGLFLYPGTLIVSGLDAGRYAWSPPIPAAARLAALAVFSAGYAFSLWAMRCNPFFSTFVRIQSERGHRVIGEGPYARVRHPGYAGAILAHAAIPLALGSLWGLVPALLGGLLFTVRAYFEDQTLEHELSGYAEYKRRVRWRLLPGLW